MAAVPQDLQRSWGTAAMTQSNPGAQRQGWTASWPRYPKIFADLSSQMVVYFVVAWNGTALVLRWVMPPRVVATFSKNRATMRREVPQQIAALHTAILSSS